MIKEILGVKAPTVVCSDIKCPFHGDVNVKIELFKGKIVKKDINRSATIEWFISRPIKKYERLALRRSKMRVHNPACINAAIGDEVLVAKTRPLSKTKNHVILSVLGHHEAVVSEDSVKEQVKKSTKGQVKDSKIHTTKVHTKNGEE